MNLTLPNTSISKMAYQSLFNALCDPVALTNFMNGTNSCDLLAIARITSQANKHVHERMFAQSLTKHFTVSREVLKKNCRPCIRNFDKYTKFYTRVMYGYNGHDVHYSMMYLDKCKIGNQNCSFAHLHDKLREYLGLSCDNTGLLGLLLYAIRTGWIVIYSEIIPKIKREFINMILFNGFHVALEPNAVITNESETCYINRQYFIRVSMADGYDVDEDISMELNIPCLVAYRNNNNPDRIILYVRSIDPQCIYNATVAVNRKISVNHVFMDTMIVVDTLILGERLKIMPYILHGLPLGQLIILVSNIDNESVWDYGTPVFREYPTLRDF